MGEQAGDHAGDGAAGLDLRLIGGIALCRDGRPAPLPPSRKTRALLAYLAVGGRAESREALCDLLWELPDDPRGALRWSLSRLRAAFGDERGIAIRADRERVELEIADDAVDWRRLRGLVRRGVGLATAAELGRAAGAVAPFLQGLDLPRCDRFQAWLVAQREDVRGWQAAVLAELTARDGAADARLAHARAWVEIDDHNPAAWQALVARLDAAGRGREAAQQREVAARHLAGTGRALPAARRTAAPVPAQIESAPPDVRFCTSADGTKLAYAVAGDGPPLVKIANWMTHLEIDGDGPIWRHWIDAFSRQRRLLRYDQRGNGLSDRRAAFGAEADLADVEAVVDAAGFDRFDLLGLSHGASVAVAYAARHPGRVRRILLLGGFPIGWRVAGDAEQIARREAMITLTRQGWNSDNPALRQLYTSLFLPAAPVEAQRWFNEVQRQATSVDNACAIQRATGDIDVRALLPLVRAPTLVAHCRDDAMVPFEAGRAMAAAIPGARFLALDGTNHVLVEDEPAWTRFRNAALAFLDEPA